jgi:hypothetical protein
MWMLNKVSSFMSHYKGLPAMIAVALVVLNFILQFFPLGWFSSSNFFLHLGIIVGLIGILMAEAIG